MPASRPPPTATATSWPGSHRRTPSRARGHRERRARVATTAASPARAPRRSRYASPAADARFGIISDVDDTILETGVQRVVRMIRPDLHRLRAHPDAVPRGGRALPGPRRRGEPGLLRLVEPVEPAQRSWWASCGTAASRSGPVLLRDLLGTWRGREQKHGRIREVLDLHPDLPFVLLGDSGEQDPADLRRHRARAPRADPGGLHPRGAARPGRRAGREGLRRLGPRTCRSCSRRTPTPYAGTHAASGCSDDSGRGPSARLGQRDDGRRLRPG